MPFDLNGFFVAVEPKDDGQRLAGMSVEEAQQFVRQEVRKVADQFIGRRLDATAIEAVRQQLTDTVQRLRDAGVIVSSPSVRLTDLQGRVTTVEPREPTVWFRATHPDGSAAWTPDHASAPAVVEVKEEPQQMPEDRFKPMRKLVWDD
jgi:hypothetical protein